MNADFYKNALLQFNRQLKEMIDSFNEKRELIALSMATQVRILVHDTQKSISLLKQLNKKGIDFHSIKDDGWQKPGVHFRKFGDNIRNINYSALGSLPSCLVGAEHNIVANKLTSNYFPISREYSNVKSTLLSFDNWWDEKVAFSFDSNNPYLTRRNIILGIANKDGGAHYNKDADSQFRNLKSDQLLNTLINRKLPETENNPLYSIVCQICYEVLKTIAPLINEIENEDIEM